RSRSHCRPAARRSSMRPARLRPAPPDRSAIRRPPWSARPQPTRIPTTTPRVSWSRAPATTRFSPTASTLPAAISRSRPLPHVRRTSHRVRLDVEQEMQDVAILDDVILAFLAQPARFARAGLAAVGDEVLVGDGFGANETALEIG